MRSIAPFLRTLRRVRRVGLAAMILTAVLTEERATSQSTSPSAATNKSNTNMVVILDIAGTAEMLPAGGGVWQTVTAPYLLRPGDRFRTRQLSRATVRLSDLSQLRLGELSEFQVQSVPDSTAAPVYRLWRGILYFFHRDKPGQFQFETPQASAAVRGTEFTLEHVDNTRTVLTLWDGAVDVRSASGQVGATRGQRV